MSWYLIDGKVLTEGGKIAIDETCCCDCPCGSGPPDISITLLATITNKTGSAICLPDSFILRWDGASLWDNYMTAPTIPPDPDGEHTCDAGDMYWAFVCGVGGYSLTLDCILGGYQHQSVRGAQTCVPFRIEFTFVLDDNTGCICLATGGTPDCIHSFTVVITELP